MLGNAPFYHQAIRKYVIVIGTMFNDIIVERRNNDGNVIQTIPVPISYGPREKVLGRIEQDPDLNRQPAINLPRITFELSDLAYAPERKLGTTQRTCAANPDDPTGDSVNYLYSPVPYDLNFTVSVMVEFAEDGTQIIEQILPFFTPDFTVSLNMIPEMNITEDVPIVLTSVTSEDTYEGDFITRRALIWTLNFSVKANLYGPAKTSNIIKTSNTNIYTTLNGPDATAAVGVTVTPGLTANGEPTSNSSLSVPLDEITASDDYGFITDFEEFFND